MDLYSLGMAHEGEGASPAAEPPRVLSIDQESLLWIARRIEAAPGQVDGEIVYVTTALDRLYGYRWPDTLLGQRIAEIYLGEDAQITRQYAAFRALGYADDGLYT